MKKNKFQIKREETYYNLLRKGIKPMMEKGYAKANIGDIAEAAEHTRGAFYFHFDSKEEYFLHVLAFHDDNRGSWADLPYQFDPEKVTLHDFMKKSIMSLWNNVYEEPMTGWLLLVIDFYQNTKANPKVGERMKELHRSWEKDLVLFIKGLKEQGFIEDHIDNEQAAWQLIVITYGFLVNYYIYDLDNLDLMIDAYVKVLR